MNRTDILRSGCCVYTTRAVNKLAEGTQGDLVTRDQMATITGRDCRPGSLGYGNVLSAIKIVGREQNKVWRWSLSDQAWKCLGDKECLELAKNVSKQGRKKLTVSTHIAGCADYEKLSKDDRQQHNLLVLQNSLATTSLSPHLSKRLESAAERSVHSPDYDAIAQLVNKAE